MKLFVIHRFKDRCQAKEKIKNIAKSLSIELKPIFLNSFSDEEWKEKAEISINQAEAVIVFNPSSCEESGNAKWEVEKVKEAGLEIIEISENGNNSIGITRIESLYELKEEFNSCFSSNSDENFDLYKLMIESSESLIQRRQKTNAFFITAIGSLLAIAGLLVKSGAITVGSIWMMHGFSVVGLLLCNSWRNLIDNYGKLNKAKFDVILRLETGFSSRIYSAEWVSLGKGLRPKKYKSFTSTEKNVPLFFAFLIALLTLITAAWQIWG